MLLIALFIKIGVGINSGLQIKDVKFTSAITLIYYSYEQFALYYKIELMLINCISGPKGRRNWPPQMQGFEWTQLLQKSWELSLHIVQNTIA